MGDALELGVPFSQGSVLAIRAGVKTQSRRVATRIRVRIRRMLTSDLPGIGLPVRVAKPGLYKARIGDHGAVVAQTSTGPLGLRPGEFDFVCPWIRDGVTHLADGEGDKRWTVVPPDPEPVARVRVLEKWRTYERPADIVDGILFQADGVFVPIENTPAAAERWVDVHKNGIHRDKWRSPWFMPRWAARTQLNVTHARLVRLQDLSEHDAVAEGVEPYTPPHGHTSPEQRVPGPGFDCCRLGDQPHRLPFADLWDELNGKRAPWASNPWVWAYTFYAVKG